MKNKKIKYESNKTKEEKQKELKDILEILENGVHDVFNSEKYKSYLEMFSKFHHYSFNNVLLILSQCHTAQRCASYITWKSLKMPVIKGEKGIKILVPIPFKYEKKKHTNENEDDETIILRGVRFKIGHVFDVSQVEGELPILVNELTENPIYLNSVIDVLIKYSTTPIVYDKSLKRSDAKGYYDLNAKTIALSENMSSMQTFKTLIHETAHSILHNRKSEHYTREEAEVQAESIAYVVCSSLGLDTSEYSFA